MEAFGVDPEVLPAFALAMVLIELTPGPNLAWLALLGAARGRRAGLRAVAGITAGLAVWLGVALLGLTRTPLYSHAGLEILRWVGAAYLAWLAWDAMRPAAVSLRDTPGGRPFVRGLVANLLNPKAAVFYIALLPGFLRPAAGAVPVQILMLGAIHIGISVAVHSAAVFGGAGAVSGLSRRQALALRAVLALGLVASAAWMLMAPLPADALA